MKTTLNQIRKNKGKTLVLGSHREIIQSILDFDYLSGNTPSIACVVGSRNGFGKYFFGNREILIPEYEGQELVPDKASYSYILNLTSARRVLSSTEESLALFPRLLMISVFAENVPEIHSLSAGMISRSHGVTFLGPATVGFLIPGVIKLGAVGGITPEQILANRLHQKTPRGAAIISASGGMTNELISIAHRRNIPLAFALSVGGDRFPGLTVADAINLAERDKHTTNIIYYGELGGYDEYIVANLLEKKSITKPIVAHVAGTVSELFPASPQFGHAKAKASKGEETARAKRAVLKSSGAKVADSFSDFVKLIE